MPTPRPIIDARIGANVATSKKRATKGSTKAVVSDTDRTAEMIGRKAPRIDPNAKSRMIRATITPMLSDDGGSPPTKEKMPLAPTVTPS